MKNRKNTPMEHKYWLLIFSIICLVLMLLSWYSNNSTGPLGFVASYSITPMQKGINSVGTYARDFVDNFDTLNELQEANSDLQDQIDALTIENNRLQQNSYELERLQELFNLDANTSEYEKIGARVISKESGNWFSTFTIDKGSNDGIEVDMNVIAGSGLVGIITKVGDTWATVRSIIDDDSNVSAMVLSTGDICTVQGDLTLMNDGVISFVQLANNGKELEVGEQLVTSYISDKYVQGLSIGVVTSVTVDSNNLSRSGYITPIVDFTQLQEVLVITEKKNIGDTTSDIETDDSLEGTEE
ncbi:MAG: rod shape-determining protein MreC [Eubacteriales bacterium]